MARNIESRIKQLMQRFPAVVLTGVRQCGKTRLVRHLCPDWPYFDLENPSHFERITRDPRFFLDQYPDGIVLDEVQEFPDLFKALRGVMDEGPRRPARFLLTGSSNPDLLRHTSETLAGRCATVELGPMKANEIAGTPLPALYALIADRASPEEFVQIRSELDRHAIEYAWLHGGYPEPVLLNDSTFHQIWMQEYRRLYVDRDIRRLFPRLDIIRYRRFISMLSGLSGSVINRAQLAASVEVSEPTIRDYIEVAAGTFVWRNLPSFERNIRKAVIKMPRGHFQDSGLLNHIQGISDLESLRNHPSVGLWFESFVIEEMLRGLQATSAINWSAHYYRTRNRAEIDLVLDGPFGVLPIEIKLGVQTSRRDVRTLHAFVEEHDLPIGLLVNWNNEATWLTPRVLQVPVGAI